MLKQLFMRLLPCISIMLVVISGANATDSTAAKSGFQFLEEPTTPRLIAMGNAGTAMQGSGFSYYNPAQPFFSDNNMVTIGYSPLPGDLTTFFGEASWYIQKMFAGVHISNFSIKDIYSSDKTGVNYNISGSSASTIVSLDMGYKGELLGLGLNVNGMQDRILTMTAYAVSVSAGAAYWLVPKKLSIGVAVLNIGTSTGYNYYDDNLGDGERLPRSGRVGAAYCDTLENMPFSVACDVVYRDVGNKLHSVKDAVPRITVPLGIEVWPIQYAAIRVGKRINFETEIISFGAALRFNPLTMDMSFVITDLEGDVEVKPTIALTYMPSLSHKNKELDKTPANQINIVPLSPAMEKSQKPIQDSAVIKPENNEVKPPDIKSKPDSSAINPDS
ncbi:MAG TPA: hypothetical protein DCO75_10050, partial [Fibrobacteres bacterium]|nr:hypothetical protein [Fibrobacterota bacterium]